METWVQMGLTSIVAISASSGFWAFILHKSNVRSAETHLMMGLAYDKVMSKGSTYIDRGWVTRDEYEDLRKYFYDPYKALGGNGVAERIMQGVSELPIVGQSRYALMFRTQPEEFVNNVRVVAPAEYEARQANPER